MPLLAVTLLWMNNRRRWVGESFRNGWLTNAVLAVTVLFFLYAAVRTATSAIARLLGE
jgi:hypothetical protein